MSATIQTALKNCMAREIERLRQFDPSVNIDEGIVPLITGTLIGAGATYALLDAGSLANLPGYLEAHAETAKMAALRFVQDNSLALMGIGGSIAGGGALIFLKGLREENAVLRERARFAFNEIGHGTEYLETVERTYDNILQNHERYGSALDNEARWIEGFAKSNQFDVETNDLAEAYIHGVKRCFAMALEQKDDVSDKLRYPNKDMQERIFEGMSDYYRAVDKQSPGVLNKLKYVLTGQLSRLKDADHEGLADSSLTQILNKKRSELELNSPAL